MGWTQPGVVKRKSKRQYNVGDNDAEEVTSRAKRLRLDASSSKSSPGSVRRLRKATEDATKLKKRVYLKFGEKKRKLRPIERLPVEILQTIFILSSNYNLAAASLQLTRALSSSFLYRSISLPYFLDPLLSPPPSLLLTKFFTLDFFQAYLQPKISAAGLLSSTDSSSDPTSTSIPRTIPPRRVLPPEILIKSKLPLVFHLLNTRILTLSSTQQDLYNDALESLVSSGHAKPAQEIYQRGVFPRESLWDVLVDHEAEEEVVVGLVKAFPFQLGFDRVGRRWVELVRLGRAGREAAMYLVNERRMIPPNMEVLGLINDSDEW